MLICPVCGAPLHVGRTCAECASGHSFDIAKEGYINLLLTSKSGNSIGDDRLSARSRRDFLNRGYYAPLRDALIEIFSSRSGSVLDICCGEGYYTSALAANPALDVCGFDIAKEMIRLAAKRGGAHYYVANMARMPFSDGSFDYATHLFAPFHEKEFFRVLRPGGRLTTVIPGSAHLFGLKKLLYDSPYLNDEQLPECSLLRFVSRQKVSAEICLETPEDIEAVFHMTPYYYHTSAFDRAKLSGVTSLVTPIEFFIGEYEKPPLDS